MDMEPVVTGKRRSQNDIHFRPSPGLLAWLEQRAALRQANRHGQAKADLETWSIVFTAETGWEPPEGGQVHAGCGGQLDPDLRRTRVRVPCGRCGKPVDQDVNVLALMAGAAAAED